MIHTTDARGHVVNYQYDDDGRQTVISDSINGTTRTTTNQYDAAGRLVETTDPLGRSVQYQYDAAGDLIKTIYPDGSTTSATYNLQRQKVSQTDQLGATTDYQYDALGDLTAVLLPAVTDPSTGKSVQPEYQYQYDEYGHRIQVTDPLGHVTRYSTDSAGRVTSVTLPLGQQSSTVYDAFGDVTSATDFNGQTITYAYNANNGELTSETVPGVATTTITYTALGQRASVTDSRGTTQYIYDSDNRLQEIVEPDNSANTPSYLQYTYDGAGDVTSIVTPSSTTSYAYDELGRAASVTTAEGTTTYKYDLDNNLIETDMPDGTVETRQYDAMNRLTDLKLTGPTGLIAEYTYTYDAAGDILSETDNTGRKVTYAYDAVYRLIEESVFDPAGDSFTSDFVYDLAGNMVQRTTDLGNDGTIDDTISYLYDANDRLTSETDNGVTTAFTYDNDGNELSQVTNSSNQAQYTWDAKGELVQAMVTSGGTTHTSAYGYDVDGNLVSETVDGTQTNYLVDTSRGLAQIVEEYTPGGVVLARYAFGHGIVEQNRQGQVAFYHADAQGSIRTLTAANGTVTDQYLYDAFGALLSHTGSTVNAYGFAGERLDATTGLINLRSRLYDPLLGRFTSADSFPGVDTVPLSLNRYIYAMDNPVNMVDPSGHYPGWISAVSRAVLGTFVHIYIGGNFLVAGPGAQRWANRRVSTIVRAITGVTVWPAILLRPDFVDRTGLIGEIYELKPADIRVILTTPTYIAATADAVAQLGIYWFALTALTPVAWSFGTAYVPGIVAWPTFARGLTKGAGYTLVTFNDYALVPGVMFYDFVPSPRAQQLETEAALGVALGVGLALAAQQISVASALAQIEALLGLGAAARNARGQLALLGI